jgi:predicted O-linked N-acetylglucosamine transferase (SPINDLY family)
MTEALLNLGLVLIDQDKLQGALVCLNNAAATVTKNRGLALSVAKAFAHAARSQSKQEQYAEAAESLRRAIELDESSASHHHELAHPLLMLGDLDGALQALERAVALDPQLSEAHSSLVFYAHFSPSRDADALLREALRWGDLHAKPLAERRRPHPHDRSPDRRLRVGYVSPDFREHPLRLFGLPVFREHDRSRFEVVAYSSVSSPDEWTQRFEALADQWHDVTALSHGELAERIREDRIDVLVDLSMHMVGNRLQTFAERPAPVQLSWFAYPGTTGVDAIDYRVTDPHLDPPGAPLPYSERSMWLPDTFWCYDPQSDEPVEELPALAAGHVTFGCLNNFLKINDGVLELYGRVMAAVPGSRLVLLAPSGWARKRVLDKLEAVGIEADRVELVPLKWRRDYLRTYARIDIALDCFPYNGHTTSLDATWMGLPVVTLVGSTIGGRAGLCHARNIGLDEHVAADAAEFVSIAAELAGDLPRLAALRHQLRGRLERSPLMDAPCFVRALEAVYRDAWQRFCVGDAVPVQNRSSMIGTTQSKVS